MAKNSKRTLNRKLEKRHIKNLAEHRKSQWKREEGTRNICPTMGAFKEQIKKEREWVLSGNKNENKKNANKPS